MFLADDPNNSKYEKGEISVILAKLITTKYPMFIQLTFKKTFCIFHVQKFLLFRRLHKKISITLYLFFNKILLGIHMLCAKHLNRNYNKVERGQVTDFIYVLSDFE